MNIALFDLDGTITTKDTFIEFLKFSVPLPVIAAGALRLAPATWRYFRKHLSNQDYKERVLTHFFAGWPAQRFIDKAVDYSRNRLDRIVRPAARDRLAWHREREDRIVIVSASIRFWLEPWSRSQGAELICTELAVEDGRITGRLATPNCYGPEKVNRIRSRIDLSAYSRIYAYGDSSGDREMLALAHEPHYRFFA